MKFLFVVTDFDMGGITASLKNLSDELIRRGHEVAMINLPGDREFPVEFHKDIQWIQLKGKAKYWNLGIMDFRNASGLRKIPLLFAGVFKKILAKFNAWEKFIFSGLPTIACDVAMAHRQNTICYHILHKKTTAKCTIAFIHSEFDGDCSAWVPALQNIDRIACVSKDWSEQFCRRFPHLREKVGTVYNLFDRPLLEKKSQAFTPEYPENEFSIVTVARVDVGQKRVDMIPRVCEILKEKTNRPFCWYLVGDGPDRGLVEQLTEQTGTRDCLRFLGAQKNPYPFVRGANLFVLMSPRESYGMVIQEALILGTPVVATDYPALHEILTEDGYGIITEPSAEALAEGLLKMMEDEDFYQAAKEKVAAYEYSTDTAYEQLMALCR